MLKNKLLLMFLLLTLGITGCISTKEYKAFVEASDKFVNSAGKDYVDYLDGDASLNSLSKSLRKETVETYKKALDEAKKRVE